MTRPAFYNYSGDYEQFKPFIFELIDYYYQVTGEGGNCHIALADGNLDDLNLFHCQEYSLESDDHLGYLIATTLRHFTEDEREQMYARKWKRP